MLNHTPSLFSPQRLTKINGRITLLVSLLFAAVLLGARANAGTVELAELAPEPESPWSWSISLEVGEAYDSNLFLQDIGGVLANRDSLITIVSPKVGLSYEASEAFKVTVSYGADMSWYHNYPSETNYAHNWALNAGGTAGETTWESTNSVLLIDGPHLGPTYNKSLFCDVPAIGGISVRNRRDAVIYKNKLRVTQKIGKFMMRPVFTSYIHDFMTDQWPYTDQPPGIVYENYLDRMELSGGVDFGYEAFRDTYLLLGYRFGYQRQASLGDVPSPYSNHYHRYLVGIEGSPVSWLKCSILGGPDVRDFGNPPPGFNSDEILLYLDATVSVTPTQSDTITFRASRYQQPSFTSHCMYEDIIYDVSWKRQFSKLLSAKVGFQMYLGDFQAPIPREDVIYTPYGSLNLTINEHLSAEISYLYNNAENNVDASVAPTAFGREFTRHYVSIGAKYSF